MGVIWSKWTETNLGLSSTVCGVLSTWGTITRWKFFFYLKKQSVQKPKHTTKAVFKKKTLPASVWTGLKSTSLKKKKKQQNRSRLF